MVVMVAVFGGGGWEVLVVGELGVGVVGARWIHGAVGAVAPGRVPRL